MSRKNKIITFSVVCILLIGVIAVVICNINKIHQLNERKYDNSQNEKNFDSSDSKNKKEPKLESIEKDSFNVIVNDKNIDLYCNVDTFGFDAVWDNTMQLQPQETYNIKLLDENVSNGYIYLTIKNNTQDVCLTEDADIQGLSVSCNENIMFAFDNGVESKMTLNDLKNLYSSSTSVESVEKNETNLTYTFSKEVITFTFTDAQLTGVNIQKV